MTDAEPAELADTLPDRPISPDTVDDLADKFAWSVQKTVYETPEGREYVPAWYAFRQTGESEDDDPRGDALALRMNDEMTEWMGEVVERDVLRSQWLEVCEKMAEATGMEQSIETVTFESDGEERRRDLSG